MNVDERRHLATVPAADHNGNGAWPQPRDIAAEQYVIGAALQNAEAFDACARIVTASDFYEPNHATIWRALQALRTDGHPTEPVAVVTRLLQDGNLAKLRGGGVYLTDCIEVAASPLNATYYARTVDRLARRRAAVTAVLKAADTLNRPGADTDVDQALVDARDQLEASIGALADPLGSDAWAPLDLTAVLAGEHLDPPPVMLERSDGIPLIYRGAVHAVSGESESGKTWLCLLGAVQLLAQGERVGFVDFEDRADRVVSRLLALGALPDDIKNGFSYIRPDRALDEAGRQALEHVVSEAALVIVDGVTEAMTVHGLDLNSNADAATFYSLLPRWIADHGPAVILIDHVVKDEDKRGRYALGAQHKLAGLDGASYLVKCVQPFGRGKRGVSRVVVAKDRPGHVREHATGSNIAEFVLDARDGRDWVRAELNPAGDETGRTGDGWEPTRLMEKVSRFVETTPGISGNGIEQGVRGKATAVRLAIELLVTRGYVRLEPGARGAKNYYHEKPYRENGDES